jgi:organic hydroperoxide reductase OsmC/OhrA
VKIRASVQNSEGQHRVAMQADDQAHHLTISPRSTGFGSSVNGGELLFLAFATCYCNDLYREAAKRGIRVEGVEVRVEGDFGAAVESAKNVQYHAKVIAQASEDEVRELMSHTDRVAEIQNTVRAGTPVQLTGIEIVTV